MTVPDNWPKGEKTRPTVEYRTRTTRGPYQAWATYYSNNKCTRTVRCGVHQYLQTSKFIGVAGEKWVFLCRSDDEHYFTAYPPVEDRWPQKLPT